MIAPLAASKSNRELLWAEYQHDRTIERRNRLVECYLPLAKKVASVWVKRQYRHEFDDLFQWATIGLISAVERFNFSRSRSSRPFTSYAWIAVNSGIMNGMRAFEGRSQKKRDFVRAMRSRDFQDDSLPLITRDRHENDLEDRDEIEYLLRPLTERERSLLLRHTAGEDTTEIAQAVGLAPRSIRTTVWRIRRMIRERLEV